MFRAKLSLPAFRHVVEALKDLTTEATFDVDPDGGMSLQAMDGSHVCLVALAVPPSAMAEFECPAPRSMSVHLGHLSKVLRCGRADVADLVLEASASDTLRVAFGDAEFEMRLLHIDSDVRLQVPDDDPEGAILLPSAEYARVFRDLAGLGMDAVAFEAGRDGLVARAEGDGMTARIALSSTAMSAATCTVGMRHLVTFARPGLSDVVTVAVAQDAPVHVAYAFGAGGRLDFYLAPKVVDEGDVE